MNLQAAVTYKKSNRFRDVVLNNFDNIGKKEFQFMYPQQNHITVFDDRHHVCSTCGLWTKENVLRMLS